jgi:ferric-dicitrate binding protein FerR (iron transport regulator)
VRRPGRRHAALLLAAAAIVAGAVAGALAYWQGSGSGSAMTVLANVQSLSLQPGTPTAQLYPGGRANVQVLVSNPNSSFVQIGSIVLDPGAPAPFAVDPGHSGCDVSALDFSAQDNGGAGWRIPPRAGSTDGSLVIDMLAAMEMSLGAANECQGATFTVQLKASL